MNTTHRHRRADLDFMLLENKDLPISIGTRSLTWPSNAAPRISSAHAGLSVCLQCTTLTCPPPMPRTSGLPSPARNHGPFPSVCTSTSTPLGCATTTRDVNEYWSIRHTALAKRDSNIPSLHPDITPARLERAPLTPNRRVAVAEADVNPQRRSELAFPFNYATCVKAYDARAYARYFEPTPTHRPLHECTLRTRLL